MSIGGLRKVGKIRFPTIRRSTDILQPESGEVDFSEALKEFDKEKARSIAETENIERKLIKDHEESERHKKKENESEIESEEQEEIQHIDVQA